MSAAAPTSAPGPVLRDIHLPPTPSWWPPAPGWWLLAALVCVLLFFAARWLLRRQRERRWRRQILAELERIAAMCAAPAESTQLAAQVSQMLRRASRLIDPGAVALRDEAWLAFLDAQLPAAQPEEAPFRMGVGRALIDAPYRRAADPEMPVFDRRALLDLARAWLDAARYREGATVFELAWPWLLAILPLPFIAARLLPRARGAIGTALHLPHLGLALPQQADVAPVPRLRRAFALLAWALLALAAARPQFLGAPEDVPRSGRDLLLAVDTSGSMSTEDMQLGGAPATRFAAIQAIAADFIHRRQGDRVGLILFGTRAYLLVPLTFDLKTVRKQLSDATIGLAGRETAIGDAVGLAVKRLRARPQKQRVLVLLTDGVNTSGELDPVQAIDLAAANGVRIYTIGIGADELRVESLFGSRVVNPSADLDEKMLTRMADRTGGRYFRARDSAELADIYRVIDRLEPAADTKQSVRPIDELYWLPLAAALLAGAFAFLLPGWRLRFVGKAVTT